MSDMRSLYAVTSFLACPEAAEIAKVWIDEDRERQRVEEQAEVVQLDRQRRELRGVSLLLKRACEVEGLSLAAVAYGVLPRTHTLKAGEGFRWSPCGSSTNAAAVRASCIMRMTDGWERKFYAGGAFIRPREHPGGMWAVLQRGGLLTTSFSLDGHLVRCDRRGRATIKLRGKLLPDTVVLGLPSGRPMIDIVGHPLFESSELRLLKARKLTDGLLLDFTSPIVPIDIAELRPETGMEHQQLGRDGTVRGDAALRDVLARSRAGMLRNIHSRRWEAAMAQGLFDDWEGERLRRVNLMAPPWAEKLQLPG